MEGGQEPWVPEGNGGWKGWGVSWGLDAWVLSRKLGSWSAPPWARPSLSTSSILSSHPNSLFDLSCPRGGQRLGKSPAAGVAQAPDMDRLWPSHFQSLSSPSNLPHCSLHPHLPCSSSLSTPELALTQEVVSLFGIPLPQTRFLPSIRLILM